MEEASAAPAAAPALPAPPTLPVDQLLLHAFTHDTGDAIDPDLQASLPERLRFTWDELLEGIDRARVYVIRMVGMPYATLFAIAVATLLNAALVYAIYRAWTFDPSMTTTPTALATGTHATWGITLSDGGNGNGGMTITGLDGLGGIRTETGTGGLREFAPLAGSPAASADPPAARDASRARTLLDENAAVPIIGMATSHDPLGDAGPVARKRPNLQPVHPTVKPDAHLGNMTNVIGPALASAQPVDRNTSAIEGRGGTPGNGRIDRGGTEAGTGEEDDGGTIDLMKPNVGKGNGAGRGRGAGDKTDFGPSGANLPQAQPLDVCLPTIPDEYAVKMYGKRVTFAILVKADGRPGKITILESTGVTEIDAICRAAALKTKFRPAYQEGKAVEREFIYGFNGPGSG